MWSWWYMLCNIIYVISIFQQELCDFVFVVFYVIVISIPYLFLFIPYTSPLKYFITPQNWSSVDQNVHWSKIPMTISPWAFKKDTLFSLSNLKSICPTSQKTHYYMSITKNNWLVLFVEIMRIVWNTDTLWAKFRLFNIKAGGTCGNSSFNPSMMQDI